MVEMQENVYAGELVRFPGAWSFWLGKSVMILVSDAELLALENPDTVLDLSLGFQKEEASLRQVCERAQAQGHRTLIVAYDHFFNQYRPGQHAPRTLTPDQDEYIQRIAAISKFAQNYGLGLELSLLSPLEVGPAYVQETQESGVWMHYRKGYRNPLSGQFSVSLWQQRRWTNNKGVIALEEAGIRAFAFKEKPLGRTPYRYVDPDSLLEIPNPQVERPTQFPADAPAVQIRIFGEGNPELGDRDRVLVVQMYKTPEMDYFSPNALPYLKKLVDRYADAGIKLHALYSDEMHIQQDWNYFGHHDNGEFALRYVSPGLAKEYARLYGEQYADFAKFLVYFAYGQEDYSNAATAKLGAMHVFGESPEEIRRTALFRSRYYRLLQNGVVDLFTAAKRHAEQRMGHLLEARAHATWAESPTIDLWNVPVGNPFRHQYEYTSNFVWSNTVHQASSACDDYFKWGDFLTGNGNDHAECGWLDRNYVGLALACSLGTINSIPYAYGAHWGMPEPLNRRRVALVNAYGASATPPFGLVQDLQHRDIEVLMLYPLDLVAVEERFGSWMTQYGYANQITADKLLEKGEVVEGAILVGGRRFTTLVVQFEPFPSKRLLALLKKFAALGGTLIWSGPPPVLSSEGENILSEWQDLFGVDYSPELTEGIPAPGREVQFYNVLLDRSRLTFLTDLLPDRVYPVTPRKRTEIVAQTALSATETPCVGTLRSYRKGKAVFLGFRPRDDQSRSLGLGQSFWYFILTHLGAYPSIGKLERGNDNPTVVSRYNGYLACRFPNGAVALAPHLRWVEEDWEGGFSRNTERDAAYLERVPPPTEEIYWRNDRVAGFRVSYHGTHAVCFRADAKGNLIAFAGCGCKEIRLNGHKTVFADAPLEQVAWAPVPEERRVEGGAVLQIVVYGEGTLHIPAHHLPKTPRLFVEGTLPGSRGAEIPCHLANNALVFTATPELSGKWLYVTG